MPGLYTVIEITPAGPDRCRGLCRHRRRHQVRGQVLDANTIANIQLDGRR